MNHQAMIIYAFCGRLCVDMHFMEILLSASYAGIFPHGGVEDQRVVAAFVGLFPIGIAHPTSKVFVARASFGRTTEKVRGF